MTDSDLRGSLWLVCVGKSPYRIKQEDISKNEPKYIKNKVHKKENDWPGSTPCVRCCAYPSAMLAILCIDQTLFASSKGSLAFKCLESLKLSLATTSAFLAHLPAGAAQNFSISAVISAASSPPPAQTS